MARRRHGLCTVLGAALLLTGALPPAAANLFVCTDGNGRTITADRVPRECEGRTIKELRPDGSVKRVIEPPLTAEQRAERAAQERRAEKERELQRAQVRRDLALMDTYASEAEIDQARKAALASRQTLIDRSTQRLRDHRRERKRLDDEAEFYVSRKLPDKLERAFANNAAMATADRKLIADLEVEMQRINERFDGERKRFRELIAAGARPASRNVEDAARN